MNEAETRAEHIDPALKAAGWGVVEGSRVAQYVKVGVDELASEKLSPLLRLKYNDAIADAFAELGRPAEVSAFFAGFQKYLYQQHAA